MKRRSILTMTSRIIFVLAIVTLTIVIEAKVKSLHDYGDALSKSILFFEGQRSGKLPPTQRMTWRKDSALRDGLDVGVDLTGGYYDAGDNVKYNFPMAYSTTMLAWSIIEYGKTMDQTDLTHALEAIRWSTDYFLKSTAKPGVVYAQVGAPQADHNCWERPEDMDTPRTVYAVTREAPGSEVSAEIAAALAASSMVFKSCGDRPYADVLLQRAIEVFEFADTYRGNYNDSIGIGVCPWYCNYNGYYDDLLWGAAWLHKSTKEPRYWEYVTENMEKYKAQIEPSMLEFGWDAKHAGINILVSKFVINNSLEATTPFLSYADKFVCSVLPESPLKTWTYTPGGLLFREPGVCNLQNNAMSFILLAYARYIKNTKRVIQCGNVKIDSFRLIHFTRSQVNYILGSNPMNMSYMVGYGDKYPQRIHHRGSTLPSKDQHPEPFKCNDGSPHFFSQEPNPNLLIGAVIGGPNFTDSYEDHRNDPGRSEPTTYVNAPLVGLLAYFKAH